MKRLLLILPLLITLSLSAQEVPPFSQKLSNSYLYNPALAGLKTGTATYSYRNAFGGVYQSNLISGHVPLAEYKFGVGMNVFTDKMNFVRNTHISAAFAYHIFFGEFRSLSMGIAPEYNILQFDENDINFTDGQNDPFFLTYDNEERFDVSLGFQYEHEYFRLGFSANRMAAAFRGDENRVLSSFYNFYATAIIPLRGGLDELEPGITHRIYWSESQMTIAGVYYTANNFITVGTGWRSGNFINLSVAFRIKENFLLGYTHEFATGYDLGSTMELTLRYDFMMLNSNKKSKVDKSLFGKPE